MKNSLQRSRILSATHDLLLGYGAENPPSGSWAALEGHCAVLFWLMWTNLVFTGVTS